MKSADTSKLQRVLRFAQDDRMNRRCKESIMFRKWIAFILLAITVLSVILLSAVSPAQNAPTSTVPASRLAHIRHGINLSEWFAQVYDPKGYTKEHFQSWNTAADIALIKSAGFDHVRLSVNPQPMMDAAQHRDGGAEYFRYLDAAVKMILDAGLAVEIDMHPDSDFKARLAKDDDFVRTLRRLLEHGSAALRFVGCGARVLRNPE